MRRTRLGLLLGVLFGLSACSSTLGGPDRLRADGGVVEVGDATTPTPDDEDSTRASFALTETRSRVTTIVATADTYLKVRAVQSSSLAAAEKCLVARGTRLALSTSATPAEANHHRVVLADALPGCALREGFVYAPHFSSVSTITATAATVLKSRIADARSLAERERCALAAGTTLVLARAPSDAGSSHFAVELEPIAGCALSRGFVYGPHFGLTPSSPPPRGSSGARTLAVDYRYQYDNRYEPSGTCGLTSASMLLGFHGQRVTPDALYERFGKAQGQSPGNLASLYRSYGLYATSTYSGTFDDIRRHIDAGRPVVVHGDFTGPGHVVVIIGYDDRGFVFNDPSGRWSGVFRGGYPGRTATNGRGVHYSLASLDRVIGPSGNVWMSVASRTPL